MASLTMVRFSGEASATVRSSTSSSSATVSFAGIVKKTSSFPLIKSNK